MAKDAYKYCSSCHAHPATARSCTCTVEERAEKAAKRGQKEVHVGVVDFWTFARRMNARVEADGSIEVHTKHGKVVVRP